MTSAQSGQAYRIIRTIERNLRRLEELVRDMEARTPEMRPQDARSELLEHVHVAGAMEQRRLFELLDQRVLPTPGSALRSERSTWICGRRPMARPGTG